MTGEAAKLVLDLALLGVVPLGVAMRRGQPADPLREIGQCLRKPG